MSRARIAEPAEKNKKTGSYPIARAFAVSNPDPRKTRVNATLFYVARDLPEPAAGPRLRDRDPLSGVHLDVPEDRTARLRRDPHRLRPRPAVHRAQGAEVLPDGLPQPGDLLRGGHQPDSRRPRRRLRPP